ncbi:Gfo/Idh/MocA family oxidoreductase [Alkalihalobacillus oceani]|uniref:Gfo/Idh/MocA family oxidoreductase n=1 Tax=Halalkalibacter oceani TaxID=1653776 RepID=A0A9X2DRT2_9BACI|nr:Gfo/Idh/MocA family oxidoreductase [Halalkalibacter oceani]MCM3715516.1 Gfo/Idh/MocA family oxidoreductase [Halalkalibacter oceani]
MKNEQLLDLDYKPKLPVDKSMGIGIVGAGEIVREAHLPAYKLAGFHVVGITNRTISRAEELAERFSIPKVYQSAEELIADPDITIIDIAVSAEKQVEIVEMATAAGKHVLCQKPLGSTYKDGVKIVELCKKAGVKGAINQQMRWAPGIRASHSIIERGWLGELLQATIQVNVKTDFSSWEFLRKVETLEVMYHSIHYMDSIRFLFGTPEYIYADGARFPGQAPVGETRTMIHMKFKDETRALIHDNHNNFADHDDWYATFRFEGTDGIVKGTNGALYNYPVGEEDTLQFYSKKIDEHYWFKPTLEGKWFPHAFIGTMGELMRAIEEDREPENSVEDNLLTLKMLFAAYQSMAENRPVHLAEIE